MLKGDTGEPARNQGGLDLRRVPVSLANPFRSRESKPEKLTIDGCGVRCFEFARLLDHDTYWVRTSQGCYQPLMFAESAEPCLEEYLESWPRSGMTVSGIAYQLPALVPRISEIESSSLLPTPSARDYKSSHASEATLSRNARPLNETVAQGNGDWLNPRFVEEMMGFPIGFTELEPSETQSSPTSQSS